MDLYDDIDAKPRATQMDGWSSGIKMLQTQLAVKKAQLPKPKPRDQIKKPLMTPVVNLRAKRTADTTDNFVPASVGPKPTLSSTTPAPGPALESIKADDWDFVDEYDPQWPNEYEKLKDKTKGASEKPRKERDERGDRDRERDRDRKRNRSGRRETPSLHDNSPPAMKFSGFGQRQSDEDRYSPPPPGSVAKQGGGAAIAPPPSLSIDNGDGASNVTIPYSASSVAAKIMAKYGFKDGQGLGKSEQGMSVALQVEKTSKRGGRIIHEKDVFLPPPATAATSPSSPPPAAGVTNTSNPTPNADASAAMPPPSLPGAAPAAAASTSAEPEPSITEIMKAPSKVVLLRNMVGPGDVDEELEPEVKDECNTKYGEVNSVIIHEAFGTVPEDAVKIFVEFKRIESAIKAVVDLNGRFFGGRQVRAGFYNFDKFKSFQLN
ncbi:hypothetical protein KR222_002944 [Zaprionus bogoriensis]|nr:hypothetical protein KR222_002944 [Zaprionus bogoriensis]